MPAIAGVSAPDGGGPVRQVVVSVRLVARVAPQSRRRQAVFARFPQISSEARVPAQASGTPTPHRYRPHHINWRRLVYFGLKR